MAEDINKLIDINLSILYENKGGDFLISHFIDSNGKEFGLIKIAQRFASKMKSQKLISINGDFANIEELGEKIYESGGWIKYLTEKEKTETQNTKNLKFKEDLDLEKTQIDLELAKRMLKEYPKTKWFARIAFIIAVFLGLKELTLWIIQVLS